MQKTADFRIISFPAHKSKEDLHLSEVLSLLSRLEIIGPEKARI